MLNKQKENFENPGELHLQDFFMLPTLVFPSTKATFTTQTKKQGTCRKYWLLMMKEVSATH